MLKEHARNAAPASTQQSTAVAAGEVVASPRARVLGAVAAWARRYFGLWRHASTDERGEVIVILPPPDRRSPDSD